MLQKKEKILEQSENKKSEWDDTKFTEMDQASPNWSTLKSQEFFAFPERKNLKSENKMEQTLWKG